MSEAKEWFSAAELAALALPDLPATRAGVLAIAERQSWADPRREGQQWRRRSGRGGGAEFHTSVLPCTAQMKLALQFNRAETAEAEKAASKQVELWARFERLPEKTRAIARTRLAALEAVRSLTQNGVARTVAMPMVARNSAVSLGSLYNWEKLTHGLHRSDWLPALAPLWSGGDASAETSPEAWEFLKADYLRLERPTFTACYRRLQDVAKQTGWHVPSERTLVRRMEALPKPLVVLARQGQEALKRMYPAQQRDRSHFHALQAVNADGHKWDVFVRWPDGEIVRPMMVAFQDLYSGKLLAWRIDKSSNKEAVRLALGDMIEQFGIPDGCWLDNGRDFASKWITGGTPNRYRFKVRDDEPDGILTQLGVAVHWTTPYAGQSKPIERAFRDLAGEVAKHPKFAGAYVGNNPMAKPENYGSAAVPLDVFIQVVGEGIAEHNARPGRRSAVCQGRSFDAVFAESYAASLIRRASAEQRRLWLLMAEAIMVSRIDGSINLMGNRFHALWLHEHRGTRVHVRFDPQALTDDLHVYSAAGAYLGAARCIEAVGFNDVDAAREHARARASWIKGVKMQAAAEKTMSIADVAAMLPAAASPQPLPETKVVRPVFGNTALKPREEPAEDGHSETERKFLASVRRLRAVPPEEGAPEPLARPRR